MSSSSSSSALVAYYNGTQDPSIPGVTCRPLSERASRTSTGDFVYLDQGRDPILYNDSCIVHLSDTSKADKPGAVHRYPTAEVDRAFLQQALHQLKEATRLRLDLNKLHQELRRGNQLNRPDDIVFLATGEHSIEIKPVGRVLVDGRVDMRGVKLPRGMMLDSTLPDLTIHVTNTLAPSTLSAQVYKKELWFILASDEKLVQRRNDLELQNKPWVQYVPQGIDGAGVVRTMLAVLHRLRAYTRYRYPQETVWIKKTGEDLLNECTALASQLDISTHTFASATHSK